jgi:hypothetical protein
VGWDSPLPRVTTEYGAIAEMTIGRRNRSTREKPVPVKLCKPQVPHSPNCYWTRVTTMGSRRLTAWAMAQRTAFPSFVTSSFPLLLPYSFISLSLRFCYDAEYKLRKDGSNFRTHKKGKLFL